MASINDKLERVRKPRVHIKYEVETEGAVVEKELPFVVGVMGDYSGHADPKDKKSLKARKFIKVDRDNFDQVMQRINPQLNLRVKNTLADDGSEIGVALKFNGMNDFEPEQLVKQVPALRELMDARNKLRDLLTKSDRSVELENILEATLQDPTKLNQLVQELGINNPQDKE